MAAFTDVPTTPSAAPGSPSSRTVLMADAAKIDNYDYPTPTLVANTYLDPPSNGYPGFQARHNGVGDVLWVDGHVKAMRPIYRSGSFGYNNGYNAKDFIAQNLGDIDDDGDLTTDELFNGKGAP